MRLLFFIAILLAVMGVLVGCGGDATPPEGSAPLAPTEDQAASAEPVEESPASGGQGSEGLDTSYDGALPLSSQLAIGTIQLEGTADGVTPEQAKALLPLWQALSGDSLQSDAETDAVLKQIEGTMTDDQVAAITSQQLTFEDMGTWMQERGLEVGRPGGGEGQGRNDDLSEEERAAMRATRQAGGGGGFGQGGFANMSEEERASMRATAEAGGMTLGRPGGGRGPGQIAFLAEQVVELLTGRAAE